MPARPFQVLIRSGVAMFVFVCSFEAQHWPLLMKPGTELEWWQVKWLAKTGDWIGFPVMVATFTLGDLQLPPTIRSIVFPLCALLWAACVYLLLGLIFRTKNVSDPKTKTDRPLREILSDTKAFIEQSEESIWAGLSPAEIAMDLDIAIDRIEKNQAVDVSHLKMLFAPTGPLQDSAMASGWTEDYMRLAKEFDALIEINLNQ